MKSDLKKITTVIELGPGTFTKTNEIMKQGKRLVDYYVVDINKVLLEKHIPILAKKFPEKRVIGLFGTFDKALCRLKEVLDKIPWENICLLSLGSTLSNSPTMGIEAVENWTFLAGKVILGHDGNTNPSTVKEAYSTPAFNNFLYGGLRGINSLTGKEIFILVDWEILPPVIKYKPFRVQVSIMAIQKTTMFEKGHMILLFESYKYEKEDFVMAFSTAGFKVITYSAPNTESNIFTITPPNRRLATH
ncbi:hypothetical protein J3F84DRAFT_349378 [Trichoderma pleuroticola]